MSASPQRALIITLLAAASLAGYLAFTRATGFPLDDAWIHQTYARELARSGQMAFLPGQPSAGSTSPLWTGLLAIGYALRLDYRAWTFALGAMLLALNAWLAMRLVERWWPETVPVVRWAAGLAVALEWRLVWAAGSGMETLLLSALVLAVLAWPGPWTGLLAGLSLWARPDGLLLAPVALAQAWLAGDQARWRNTLLAGAAAAAAIAPYLLMNWLLAGEVWPNTFFAKQAEYAVLREQPLLQRLFSLSLQPWVGGQVLLLPGLALSLKQAWQTRRWLPGLALAWAAVYVAAYALRLPVTYQHGRYLMPVIPVLLALGVGGTAAWLQPNASAPARRLLSRGMLAAVVSLWLAFWAIGASAYGRDVRVIESEMVAAARWVSQNTPPGALVAAHDIGALGYFGGRPLLDLAGLVSPEVIPFIRDEARLARWLTTSGAEYLVTFPGWYPDLVRQPGVELLFTTGAPYSPALGGENMAVYRWPPP